VSNRLEEILRGFSSFLTRNWEAVRASASGSSVVDAEEVLTDWAQANWELLVETYCRELAGGDEVFLEPYGEGADCNSPSSRVWLPNATPTHRVVCRPMHGEALHDMIAASALEEGNVVFDQFARRTEQGWYEAGPPFDCVMGYLGEREVLLSIDEISFTLEPVERQG